MRLHFKSNKKKEKNGLVQWSPLLFSNEKFVALKQLTNQKRVAK